MKIGIIGSGKVGRALAGSATRAGHEVCIASQDPSHAAEAAKATHSRAAASIGDAVKDADLVVLAVPGGAVDQVVGVLAPELDGKVIIDVSNRVDTKDPGRVMDGSSTAERIQQRAPKAHVFKAFNHAFAPTMEDPRVEGTELDAFVAGDDRAAKQKVLEFAASIGFRPIDAGPLVMARALEGMALLNIMLQIQNGWPWRSGWKLVGPTGEKK